MINSDNTTFKITGVDSTSPVSLSANQWGYNTDSASPTTFMKMPGGSSASAVSLFDVDKSSQGSCSSVSSCDRTVAFGANIGSKAVGGTYSTTVTYTVTSKPEPYTPPSSSSSSSSDSGSGSGSGSSSSSSSSSDYYSRPGSGYAVGSTFKKRVSMRDSGCVANFSSLNTTYESDINLYSNNIDKRGRVAITNFGHNNDDWYTVKDADKLWSNCGNGDWVYTGELTLPNKFYRNSSGNPIYYKYNNMTYKKVDTSDLNEIQVWVPNFRVIENTYNVLRLTYAKSGTWVNLAQICTDKSSVYFLGFDRNDLSDSEVAKVKKRIKVFRTMFDTNPCPPGLDLSSVDDINWDDIDLSGIDTDDDDYSNLDLGDLGDDNSGGSGSSSGDSGGSSSGGSIDSSGDGIDWDNLDLGDLGDGDTNPDDINLDGIDWGDIGKSDGN